MRTFRQDLDGALVSSEADVLEAIPDQVVPTSASQSGLISRALASVDMGLHISCIYRLFTEKMARLRIQKTS